MRSFGSGERLCWVFYRRLCCLCCFECPWASHRRFAVLADKMLQFFRILFRRPSVHLHRTARNYLGNSKNTLSPMYLPPPPKIKGIPSLWISVGKLQKPNHFRLIRLRFSKMLTAIRDHWSPWQSHSWLPILWKSNSQPKWRVFNEWKPFLPVSKAFILGFRTCAIGLNLKQRVNCYVIYFKLSTECSKSGKFSLKNDLRSILFNLKQFRKKLTESVFL